MIPATLDAAEVRSARSSPRIATWAGWFMTAFFVLFMAVDITVKLLNLPIVDQAMAQLGWGAGYGPPIGALELALIVLYLIPGTSTLGAILLTGLFGGAIAVHVRVHDPLFSHVLFGVYLGVFAWGGLWLRRPALRAFMPIGR
jgi:hypothetical protein